MEEKIIITWPESQILFELEGFEDNCELLLDTEKYGSSAYEVNKQWYETTQKIIIPENEMTEQEAKEYFEDAEADAYLSSMEAHEIDFID